MNSGPVKDLASSQALGSDNGSAEGSSYKTILEAPQRPAGGDAPLVGKSVWPSGSQKVPKNPGAIGAGDPIKINALPGNEESSREDEIAAEIK